jgi:hypothetical protein
MGSTRIVLRRVERSVVATVLTSPPTPSPSSPCSVVAAVVRVARHDVLDDAGAPYRVDLYSLSQQREIPNSRQVSSRSREGRSRVSFGVTCESLNK